MSTARDLIQEVIDSSNLQPIMDFFTPERSAEIIKSLLEIYEITYGTGSQNPTFVVTSFEKIVISHSGWLPFMDSNLDDVTKNLVYSAVSWQLYEAGRLHLITQSEAE